MSIKLMSQVWDRDVSGTDQQVLLILCDHADDSGGSCYPSMEYIAWKMGVSTRTVMRALARLERARAITVRRTHKRVNKYTISLDALPPKEKFLSGKVSPKMSDTDGTQTTSTNHQEDATGPGRQAQGPGTQPSRYGQATGPRRGIGRTHDSAPHTIGEDASEYEWEGVPRASPEDRAGLEAPARNDETDSWLEHEEER